VKSRLKPFPVRSVGARVLLALGLLLTLATCRDAFEPRALARIALAPVLPSQAALADFGLTIDGVRFVVVRPPSDTLADTTVALPPDVMELALDLRVPIVTNPESLSVSVIALGGTIPLFAGTRLVRVPTPLPPPEIPVGTYVGPAVDSIVILPRTPFVLLNDSLRFQVQAFNGGVPVSQFFVSWSTSDTTAAPISSFGVLRAPAARGAVWVRAGTPSGATDSVTANFSPPATQLVLIAGAGQSNTVGTPLATPLEVEARAADGLPVGGVTVRFRALAGGGSVSDSVVVTDGAGRARTTATLGGVLGGQNFQASVAGLGGSPVTFAAVAFAGTATQLVATAGNLQSALVGTAVATDPAVRAQDLFGNPVPGASITFVATGGGTVAGSTQLTNGAGVATVGSWTLGTTVGTDTLTATLSGVTPVKFTATALAAAASRIQAVAGGGETVTVNTAVTTAPAVQVTDQFGNPVDGVSVAFAVASGGGSLAGPVAVATVGVGIATSPAWTIGTAVGGNTLTATATGLTGSPVTFTVTGTAAAASLMVALAGDGQAGLPGTTVSVNPALKVTDQFGNPIASVLVTFTPSVGGSVTGPTVATGTSGVATVGSWTLGTAPGPYTLDGTSTGLPTVTFTAQAIASTASDIALNGGNGQTAPVGTALAAYSVKVLNAGGAPVAGVPVSWAVPPSSGTIAPAQSTTDAAGIATATRTLGTVAGTQTATASVGGLTGSPVNFTATALPSAASQIVKQSLDPQTGTVATAVTTPVVKVTDQFGNGVSGVIVDFAATGGGSVGAAKDTSDNFGLATAGSWTLGPVAGPNAVTTTASGLSAVSFAATGVAGPPVRLTFITDPGRSFAGDAIDPPVRVAIQDQFGNTVLPAKDVVTLRLGATPDPAAKLVGTVDVAALNGVAVFANLAIDSAGIGYTLLASALNRTGVESQPFDIGGVIGAIPVTPGPIAAALNPQTKQIYVPGTSAVSVLQDDRELGRIQGFEASFAVALDTQPNQIYVTGLAGVVVIDGSSNTIRTTIPVGPRPKGIAVDEASDRVYVVVNDPSKGSASLVPIDGSKNTVVTGDIVQLPDTGVGVAFNPNDGFVYVVIPAHQSLLVIDPKPGNARVVDEILGMGKGTYGVAIDVPTNVAYVTNRDDRSVSVVDFVKRTMQPLSVGDGPEGLAIDSNRRVVYVSNSLAGTLSLIDGVKLNVFATLVVGPVPKAAVVDPVSGKVYVPTQQDDMVRVIQP